MPLKTLEENREYARLRYYKTRERRLHKQREWDLNNKHKKRLYDKKRRETKNENKITNIRHYSKKHHFPILIKKYSGCQICNSEERLEIHHIRYSKDIKDVLLLCQPCHKKVHRKV